MKEELLEKADKMEKECQNLEAKKVSVRAEYEQKAGDLEQWY